MPDPQTPSDIAREVLRRLAMQRIAPTPDNYRELYQEIAGTQEEEAFPERQLKLIASSLSRSTPEQLQRARRFETALTDRHWPNFRQTLTTLLTEPARSVQPWAGLIGDLLVQLQRSQAGLPDSVKREALTQLLAANTADPELLFSRLQGMVKGWSQMPTAVSTPSARVEAADLAAAPETWREVLAGTLENAIGMLLIDTPELASEATALAREMRQPGTESSLPFEERLKKFAFRVQWVAQDQSYIRQALLNLLQLVLENISELVVDDKWLSGQMSVLLELFSRPLDKDVLEEVRERLRDVIYKQGTLKSSLSEAQNKLREMLASFVEQLGELADSTGDYHDRMEQFASRVAQASDLSELTVLIGEVITETRRVEERARSSQHQLTQLRNTVDQAYREIARLEGELEQASELVRHDPLTGALNRKGLEETLSREVARMRRRQAKLCIAMLDVDDFKKLNDSFGHATGDEVLKHLANVVRECLRPQDSCGRYGGEEFLIVLPDTRLNDAVSALTRLQRELTKRFFLQDQQKILITFSAGITQLGMEEDPLIAIDRADKAMYRAKRAGKNRVEAS